MHAVGEGQDPRDRDQRVKQVLCAKASHPRRPLPPPYDRARASSHRHDKGRRMLPVGDERKSPRQVPEALRRALRARGGGSGGGLVGNLPVVGHPTVAGGAGCPQLVYVARAQRPVHQPVKRVFSAEGVGDCLPLAV